MKERKTAGRATLRLIPAVLLAVLYLIIFLTGATAAEKTVTVTAREASEQTEEVISRKGKAGNVLYIPGTWDITRIRLSVNGQEPFQLGKEGISADPETPVDLTPYLG